jgi:hypothetical protein
MEPAVRASKPGRYHVDQIEPDPFHSAHTSRRWGVGLKLADGLMKIVLNEILPRRSETAVPQLV